MDAKLMRKAGFFNTAIVAAMLLFGAAACGSAKNDVAAQGQTGAVSFKVKWVTPADKAKAPSGGQTQPEYAASINCAALGVSTVMEAVTDASANVLVVGGPFACTAGQGTITGIPAGSGYSLVFQGISSGNTVVYQGIKPNIAIQAGITADAGIVTVAPVTATVPVLGTSSVGTSATSIIAATAAAAGGASTGTGTGTGTGTTSVPTAPTGVSAMAGDAQATVSWTAVTGATSYDIYYGTIGGATGNGTKVTGATSPNTITGLTNGTTYYFVVAALNADGKGMASGEVSATPQVPAPTGIGVTAGNGQVTVSWTAVTGATSYNVYYRTSTGVTAANGTKVTGATSPNTITGLTNGTTYYFVVTAVNAGGESAVSSEVSAMLPYTVQKVPDTGQTACYDSAGTVIACAGTGQDGAYTINPPSYTDNGNGTITDNVTGMMWQKQDDATLRDWATAGTYCTGLNLGGHTDWRLPSRMNIITIVNAANFNPAINATYFPSTQSSYYWSSATFANGIAAAWSVGFNDGGVFYNSRANTYYARCVRLGQQNVQSFTDNGDGTITDNVTTMMWQKQDDGTMKTWANALTYCTGLNLGGHTDWRLPNYFELSSIVDDTVSLPAINATYFPGTVSSDYWSSTTDAANTTFAWIVNFFDGLVASNFKPGANYARCVRLGQ